MKTQEEIIATVEKGQFTVIFQDGDNNIKIQEAIGFRNGFMEILGIKDTHEGEIHINAKNVKKLITHIKDKIGEISKGSELSRYEIRNGDSFISSILTVS